MAIIDLGPSRFSQIGMRMGQGASKGLQQILEQHRQEQLRKQRVQQQYQDLQGLSEALQAAKQREQDQAENMLQMAQQAQSGGPPQARDYNQVDQPKKSTLDYVMQQFEPQTKFGMQLAKYPLKQQMKQPETYTLGPGEVRYKGGQPIARGGRKRETVQIDAYKNGKRIPMRIPKQKYNAFIQKLHEAGYSFNEPEEGAQSIKVDLYNPDTGKTIKARRGSQTYNKLMERGYQEGTPDMDQGEWFTKAEEQLGRFYGKLTDSGVVINPKKADEYNRASTLLEDYRQQGMDPYKAASKARKDAKTFFDKLESIPRLSGTWGGLSQGNTQKVHKNVGDLLQSGYDTREIRDFLVQERGWSEDDAIQAMKTAYEEYVAE
jgi:hypothetical protein